MSAAHKIIQDVTVPRNTGKSLLVDKGQVVRVIGTTIVDFVAFNRHDLTDRFDQARTKVYNRTLFVTTGHTLMTKANHKMLTIVEDLFKEGHHDLQHGMCSRSRFELAAKEGRLAQYYFREIPPDELPDHGCWENFIDGLKGWKISDNDIPSPFNINQNVSIDPKTGLMLNLAVRPRPGSYIDMRAEMDCLVAVSSCPDLWAGGKQGIQVQVYQEGK